MKTTELLTIETPETPLLNGCLRCGGTNRVHANCCRHCGQRLSTVSQKSFIWQRAARSAQGRCEQSIADAICHDALTLPNGEIVQFGFVADGCGGQAMSVAASQIATQTAYTVLRQTILASVSNNCAFWQRCLEQAMQQANQQVYQHTQRQKMGTTLTLALIVADQLCLAHIGDSRAYVIAARGGLRQLTTDHTLAVRLDNCPQLSHEESASYLFRDALYRWVGAYPTIQVDMHIESLLPGDTVLLCTDGLSDAMSEEEIVHIVCAQQDVHEACAALITRGIAYGTDNASAVLFRSTHAG